MLEITQEQLRETLDKKLPFNMILNETQKFLLQPPIKNPLLNTLKEKAEMYRNFNNTTLLKWFIEETIGLVEGTKLCYNTYTAQSFLKTIWETSKLGIELIHNIRNNIVLDVPKPDEPEMTPGELRALRMREAKARKKAEREELERLQKEKEEILAEHTNKKKLEKEAQKQETVQPKVKEMTAEELAHIEYLRSL